jgi:pyruvate/2-oxoglutarate dehydrogenase complex dihydrolipoamide dehydrogenase (E3) component
MLGKTHKKFDYDLIVIGSGSGGSVGAHYAKNLGKKVAIFEKTKIGGECPNWACVPTKALLHSANILETVRNTAPFGVHTSDVSFHFKEVQNYKELVVGRTGTTHGSESMVKEGIDVFHSKADFISPHEIESAGKVYSAKKFLIATGSEVFIPSIPGLNEAGFLTFKELVAIDHVPESILILGGGAVGCEFSQIFSTFGSRVSMIVRSRILNQEDEDTASLAKALLEYKGVKILDGAEMIRVEKNGNHKQITYKNSEGEHSIKVEEILVAAGKKSNLDFAPEKAGLLTADGKFIVNKYLQTRQKHIYAAGDLVGPFLFTHTGYYQSFVAAKNAFSFTKTVPDYKAVPRCVFITPEVASVGENEMSLKEKGVKYKVGASPMTKKNLPND